MKKFITVFGLLAVSALALTGCGKSKETLKIYNAGEYIDTSLISNLKKQINARLCMKHLIPMKPCIQRL